MYCSLPEAVGQLTATCGFKKGDGYKAIAHVHDHAVVARALAN